MDCQVCKQNQATVRYIEVQDKQSTEVHLCQSCAEEKGITVKFNAKKASLSDLLAKFADDATGTEEGRIGALQCEECGMRYSAFKESGRLGCSSCYKTFELKLRPLLRRIHGSTRHLGKHPSGDDEAIAVNRQMQELEDELQKAIDGENFERAADLRDQLKEMETVQAKESKTPTKGE